MAYVEFDKSQTRNFKTQVLYHTLETPENSGVREWLDTIIVPNKGAYIKLDISETAKYPGLVEYLLHAYRSIEKEECRKESKAPNNFCASEHKSEMFHAQYVQEALRKLQKL
ncbi:hypothetical protein LAU_0076 [Lausannevirus]|uniref:Uncharacterized protein n=2 Tax=Lausannevirus TaxID=999883 RepID=A0A0N7G2C8_9VIRU|nr:hypothetical protein LAU_0076 [Lausannevirus]AEA06930.1 hypothetical protein LAU_0076 [Lausannevirus]ALH06768.1 hypothetical protein PMV_070 [Port-miou virus]